MSRAPLNSSEGLEHPVPAGRIYAGQAGATRWPSGSPGNATLASRIGANHLRGGIRGSTFRLTLAAILLRPLDLARTAPRRLDPASEHRLSTWIHNHLQIAVHPVADRDPLADLEHRVLLQLDPPLNLDGMPLHRCAQRSPNAGPASHISPLTRGVCNASPHDAAAPASQLLVVVGLEPSHLGRPFGWSEASRSHTQSSRSAIAHR